MSKIRAFRPIRGLICLLLTLILLLSSVGCAGSGEISVPVWNRVMTVGRMDVSYDLLRYFVMNSIHNSSTDPERFQSDPDTQAQLEEDVYQMLRLLASYVELADRYKLTLTRDERKALKDQIEDSKDAYKERYDKGWKEEYQAYLDEN